MNKEYSISELYAEFLTTSELVRNRPDAVCTHYKKRPSIFSRKLSNIKRYAEGMKPSNQTEKVFLEAILGRELPKQELVKVEWFPVLKNM